MILALNEREALEKLWGRMPSDAADEVLAVDGGSADGTVAFLRDHGVRVLGQPRRGRGVAMRVAAEAAEAEALCFFSPDGNEDPGDIPRLFERLETCDLAIASRMMPGAFNEEDVQAWRPRKWANQAFTLAANILWNRGPWVSDSINGFRAIRRPAFLSLACDEDGFAVEYQMTIRALKKGLRVAEIPTHEGPRLGGESTAHSWRTGSALALRMLKEL